LTHRLGRAKAGKTVHFQLTPLDQGQERTAHGHPDEPSRHIHGRRACTQESPWECSHRWRRSSEHRP
jgi:hypothetical protein